MNILNNYLKKYTLYIFIFLTLIIMLLRVPFWDETHAFEIATLKLSEIFYLTRIEGHTILWFLILKPFSHIKLYPYSMFFINWLFCIASVFILFKKAHFSYVYKALIAFSSPFLLYFAPVARCYSIGIFFIFLICAYFPYRFKKPYLFSSFIVLASQTSILAFIGVFYIWLIYIYELFFRFKKKIADKTTLFIVLFIFLLTLIFTFFEFVNIQNQEITLKTDMIKNAFNFIWISDSKNIFSFLLKLFSLVLFCYLPFFLYKKSKKGLFFIVPTFTTLALIFIFLNSGNYWNYYFYYIYFIVLFWIYGKNFLKTKLINILFGVILFLMTLPSAVQNGDRFEYIYSSHSKDIANYIAENQEYKNSKLYTLEWWSDISPGANIYLKQKGIKIYNKDNIQRGSFEDNKKIFKLKNEIIDIESFIQNAPDNFFVLSDGNLLNQKFKNCIVEKKPDKSLVFNTMNNKYLFKNIDNKSESMGLIVYKVIKL